MFLHALLLYDHNVWIFSVASIDTLYIIFISSEVLTSLVTAIFIPLRKSKVRKTYRSFFPTLSQTPSYNLMSVPTKIVNVFETSNFNYLSDYC